MRLRALLAALAVATAFAAPAAAAGKKPERRLGAAYAQKRRALPPVLVQPQTQTRSKTSAGTACRSRAKG